MPLAIRSPWPALLALALVLAPVVPALSATDELRLLDRVVAIVNEEVITERELARELQRVKYSLLQETGRLPPDEAILRQVLERMIVNRLQLQKAEESGVQVDDLTLNKTMERAAAENDLTLDQFRAAIEREGERYADFRERMRDEIVISRLQQQQVQSLVTVSDQEIDDFLVLEGDPTVRDVRYRLAQILVEIPEAATPDVIAERRGRAEAIVARLDAGEDFGQVAIARSDDQRALSGGELGWFRATELPPLFLPVVRELEPGQHSAPVRSPSGYHILKLVEVSGLERHYVSQTRARHILIRPNELVSDDTARRRLAGLRERILEGGEDFAELAKVHSEDRGSAAEGGDLGWIDAGEMVPRFERVMDGLPVGVISEPFRSRYGWHIVEVLDRRSHDDTEEVRRNQARQVIIKRKAEEAIELWLRRLRDEAYVEVIERG